jgi:hypothetical protein
MDAMTTAIDEALLGHLRRYEAPEAGISEEFLPLGPDSTTTLAVLTEPLGEKRSVAWIICPSLGKERSYLRRLEALLARRLAAGGFSTLRLRGGCENDGGTTKELSLAGRLAEAEQAVDALVSRTGIAMIGAAGVLAGGMVAALTSERLGLHLHAGLQPVIRGRQYLKDALRMQSVAALVEGEDGRPPVSTRKALDELETQGWTVIRGFRLSRHDHDEISAADLTKDMQSFQGTSLLIGISRSGKPGSDLSAFSSHLEAIGGHSSVRAIEDPLVAPFGECYFRDDGLVRVDTRLPLDRKLADALVEWSATGEKELAQPGG